MIVIYFVFLKNDLDKLVLFLKFLEEEKHMQLTQIAADQIKEILAQNENSENLKLRVEIEALAEAVRN
jgi:hypothetical protein